MLSEQLVEILHLYPPGNTRLKYKLFPTTQKRSSCEPLLINIFPKDYHFSDFYCMD